MEPITAEEWGIWKAEPMTREFLRRIKAIRDDVTENLAEGKCLNIGSAEATHAQTAYAVGHINGLNFVLNDEWMEE